MMKIRAGLCSRRKNNENEKAMRFILILIGICSWSSIQAQFVEKLGVSTEYRYLGRNVAGLGLEYRLHNRDAIVFNVGAKAFYTSVEGKATFLPQLNVEYGRLLNGGLSITPYAIEPQFILNFLNFLKFNTGYAIPIHREKYFRGITFGIQVNIAVKNGSKFYYDRLSFGI